MDRPGNDFSRNKYVSRLVPCCTGRWKARIAGMRILLVGAGGVGTAFARIAARRAFAELVIADYDLARAQRAAAARDGYQAVRLDARDEEAAAGLLARYRCDVLMNA